MGSSSYLLPVLIAAVMFLQARCIPTIIGLYGETIEVPCNNGVVEAIHDLIFTKWKYEKSDGTAGDLLVKQAHKEEATIQATDRFRDRVSISANYSLLIADGTLADQTIFTCMLVWGSNVKEYPVEVIVHKRPSPLFIKDRANQLENGQLTTLGECYATDANPAAMLSWKKNGLQLDTSDPSITITSKVVKEPTTGLSTTSSLLQYTAGKEDVGAQFTCLAVHETGNLETTPEIFTIHYPTEVVTLQVLPKGTIKEGDDVTLRCHADGNPPPTSFIFFIKEDRVPVVGNDTYVLRSVTRDSTGSYRCSLPEDEKMQGFGNLLVNFLDLSLSPSGTVLKNVGDTLVVDVQKNASGVPQVSWTKNNGKLDAQPDFKQLTYGHAGLYVLEMSVAGIKRIASFSLDVQGKPKINYLTEQLSADGKTKVLSCQAEGSPEPSVQWSINGTNEKSTPHANGMVVHSITVEPRKNLTVVCTVSNSLGEDSMAILVASVIMESVPEGERSSGNDQAKLIVGIVVGLILAAAIVGLIYWLYMKNSRQGSWKTREKEMGTSEEEKKLEENNHKADV